MSEAARDRQVARETVRHPKDCNHCNPGAIPEPTRTCTSQHHVFGEESISLVEGESKPCLCYAVAASLRDGRLHLTVRVAAINERINVSIAPVRSVLDPGDTLAARVDPDTAEWVMPGEQPHPPASECHLDACTYPYPHSHGTDR
jgi:hypothetical protein